MSPPAADVDIHCQDDVAFRPSKKQKRDVPVSQETVEGGDSTAVRRHPLGVRPSGNAFTSKINLKAACGTFALLPDEILASFLEYLQPSDLLRLGSTCRALHAFTRSEELWKAIFVE